MQCKEGVWRLTNTLHALMYFPARNKPILYLFLRGDTVQILWNQRLFWTTDEGDDYVTYILSVAGFRRLHAGMIENY